MEFGAAEVGQLLDSVWSTVLGWEIEQVAGEPGCSEEALVGCVSLSGAWTGSVLLRCHRDLARQVAEAVFGPAEGEVPEELVQDALGELTNIVAGHLKALFGAPCSLGLPSVVSGPELGARLGAGATLLRVEFRSRGLPLGVEVRQHTEGEPRGPHRACAQAV